MEKYETERTRLTRRKIDFRKALRKKRISDTLVGAGLDLGNGEEPKQSIYDNLNQYSKNKIHHSNRRFKTNNKGPKKRRIHGNYSPSYNPSPNEMRRNDSMKNDEEELNEE